jgi:hypothetical protein
LLSFTTKYSAPWASTSDVLVYEFLLITSALATQCALHRCYRRKHITNGQWRISGKPEKTSSRSLLPLSILTKMGSNIFLHLGLLQTNCLPPHCLKQRLILQRHQRHLPFLSLCNLSFWTLYLYSCLNKPQLLPSIRPPPLPDKSARLLRSTLTTRSIMGQTVALITTLQSSEISAKELSS